MNEVSLFRLYLMRAAYAFMFTGLVLTIWPGILHHPLTTPLMDGAVSSLLAGASILAAIGIRYPLQMLPLMFFELVWKSIWLLAFALPLWRANAIDADTRQTVIACSMGVIFLVAIPWPYVYTQYMKRPSDRWR